MNFKKISTLSLVLLVVITFFSFKNAEDIKDWFLAGSAPSKYEIGTELDSKRNGNVGYLKSTKSLIYNKFGTMMQSFAPTKYVGKRVKLTAFIKSEDVKSWAGMWMRIDGDSKFSLSFDNMYKRAIKGTTDWAQYEIVLDVPEESVNLAFGVLLTGTGKVWMDDFKFQIVDSSTPLTATNKKKEEPKVKKASKPSNLNFDN